MAASHFASSWSSFALFSVITRNSIIIPSLFSLHSLSPTLSFSKCDDKKSTAAFITTRICRATKILKFVSKRIKRSCSVVVEAEREKREKILYLSFLSVCDDFCQKFFSFVGNTFRTKIKRQKRRRRKFNHEFFPKEREKRDLVFLRFILIRYYSREENVY